MWIICPPVISLNVSGEVTPPTARDSWFVFLRGGGEIGTLLLRTSKEFVNSISSLLNSSFVSSSPSVPLAKEPRCVFDDASIQSPCFFAAKALPI